MANHIFIRNKAWMSKRSFRCTSLVFRLFTNPSAMIKASSHWTRTNMSVCVCVCVFCVQYLCCVICTRLIVWIMKNVLTCVSIGIISSKAVYLSLYVCVWIFVGLCTHLCIRFIYDVLVSPTNCRSLIENGNNKISLQNLLFKNG